MFHDDFVDPHNRLWASYSVSLQEPTHSCQFFPLPLTSFFERSLFSSSPFSQMRSGKIFSRPVFALFFLRHFQSFCCSKFLFSYFVPDSGFPCELWGWTNHCLLCSSLVTTTTSQYGRSISRGFASRREPSCSKYWLEAKLTQTRPR